MIIRTYRVPQNDFKGARIRAEGNGRQITVPYNFGVQDAFQFAAEKLAGGPVERIGSEQTPTGFVYRTVEQ